MEEINVILKRGYRGRATKEEHRLPGEIITVPVEVADDLVDLDRAEYTAKAVTPSKAEAQVAVRKEAREKKRKDAMKKREKVLAKEKKASKKE